MMRSLFAFIFVASFASRIEAFNLNQIVKQKIQEATQKKSPPPAPPAPSLAPAPARRTPQEDFLEKSSQAIPTSKSTCGNPGRSIYPGFFDASGRTLYCFLSSVANFKKLAEVSGASVFSSGPHSDFLNFDSKKSFGHYNPQFLNWVSQKAVPVLVSPKFRAANQKIFDDYFKKTALEFYKGLIFAKSKHQAFSKMVAVYQTQLNSPSGVTAGSYMLFREILLDAGDPLMTSDESIGFWVRRSLDGSFKSMSGILLLILDAYAPREVQKMEDKVVGEIKK